MKMNDLDVSWYKSQVVASIVRRLGFDPFDASFLSPIEVYEQIAIKDKKVFELLIEFFVAYNAWWGFQEKHEVVIEQGNGLPEPAYGENLKLIEKRDQTRKALLKELEKYDD